MVELSSGVGGSNPVAGSEIWSSQLGKTEDLGVWLSLGMVQTTDRKQSVSSHGAQSRAGLRGRIPGIGAKAVVHFTSRTSWLKAAETYAGYTKEKEDLL